MWYLVFTHVSTTGQPLLGIFVNTVTQYTLFCAKELKYGEWLCLTTMPTSAIEHRMKTGCFTWTLMSILLKKALSFTRIHCYRGLRVARRTVSLCLAFFFFTLLLLCGDVEANPGPDHNKAAKNSDGTNVHTRPATRQMTLSMATAPAPVELTLSDIMARLAMMDSTVCEKLDSVKEDVRTIKDKMEMLQSEIDGLKDHVRHLQTENDTLRLNNNDLIEKVQKLEKKTDDLEGRSRRNNLIFHGLEREADETSSSCEDRLREIFTDRLELAEDIMLDRVHRLSDKPNAPLIARFTLYKHKTSVLRAKQKLKGTNIFVSEDFSETVREVRKKLRTFIPELKTAGKRVKMVHDHLLVDGKKLFVSSDGQNLIDFTP